jgi:aminoglycoside phosphotransferase family enzyme/predicted kinase
MFMAEGSVPRATVCGARPEPVSDVVAALADPAFYPHRPARVDHLQTHISHVFLAGPYAYKLKKPVHFPFLDASTADSRRALCEEELRLNWRLAAPIYLGVLPITRDETGRLALDGAGNVVDRVVWMRRLPDARTLEHLVTSDSADPGMLECLAHLLADFHADAPSGPDVAAHATPEALDAAWHDVLRLADPLPDDVLPRAARTILADFAKVFIARHATLLARRRSARRIREGHGDLRAEHVYVIDAPVLAAPPHAPLAPGLYVVDCLEFSRPLRCVDVASEVAFLAMDLERLGRPDHATVFVDSYVAASGDRELHALMPFYCAYRACVRGAVDGLKAAEPEVAPHDRARTSERARTEFALAVRQAWRAQGPTLIVCCGLSGTGKTALAAELTLATGFAHVSSDTLREQAFPSHCPAPYGGGRYAPAARAAVYRRLCQDVGGLLAAGGGVIADATFIRRTDRDALSAVAARHGTPILFLECDASPDVVRRRLDARTEGPSDARWSTYLRQREAREPFDSHEPHRRVPTEDAPASIVAELLVPLWRWRADAHGPATA